MIAALVPAKALDQAKGRLAAALSEDERRLLALAMLEDVLRSLQAIPRIGLTAVVSPDDAVLSLPTHLPPQPIPPPPPPAAPPPSLATALGAEPIAEPPAVRGINQALSHARELLDPRGAGA